MSFLKHLVVLSLIFLGLTLGAMEKEVDRTLYFHIEASQETYDNRSHHDYLNQSNSSTTLISGVFDTSIWGEKSDNIPQENTYINEQQRDLAEYHARDAIAEDYAIQQQDKYAISTSNAHINRANEIFQTKDSFDRPHINFLKEIVRNIRSEAYRKNLYKVRASLEKEWNKYTFGNAELKKQIAFIDAVLDGSINRTLIQIKKGDLKKAKKAFIELKKTWPWKEADFNSNIVGHSVEESDFITLIGTDVIQVAQNSLILRKDYLEAHNVSVQTIQTYQSKIRDMQLQGDKKVLIAEREQLIKEILKERYADFKLAQETKLALLDTILSNPLTQMLSTIKNARLDKAIEVLDDFKEQLFDHFEERHITNKAEAKADMIRREGVDLIAVANKCFKSRPDYQKQIAQQKTILHSNQNTTQIDSLDMVSTAINQNNITITPEANQRIEQTLNTLNDQSLEACLSHIDTLATILQEQRFDAETHGQCFALALQSYGLLQKYTENPNKRIVEQPTINEYIFNTRKDALNSFSHNPTKYTEQFYKLTPEACAVLESYHIDPNQFIYCFGNGVQHQLHTELVTILNEIAHISLNASTQPLFDMVATYTQVANVYTQQNELEKAFSLADCAWAALDCAKAVSASGIDIAKKRIPEIAEGMFEGCINAIYNTANMIINPRETLHNIRESFSHLGKCLVTFAVSIDHPEDFFINLEINEVKAELRQEIMENILAATSQMTFKGTVSFVTEQLVSGKLFCLGMSCVKHYADPSLAQLGKIAKALKDKGADKAPKFVSAICQQVTDKLGNFTKAEHVAVTAEGIEVTVSNAQKEANTLHNAMDVEWAQYKFKHAPQKNMPWKEVVKSTKHGVAKYKQGINIKEFELHAWKHGRKTTNGKNWKVFKADDIIGANSGKETCYVRVECSGNSIHGHPILESEYLRYLK